MITHPRKSFHIEQIKFDGINIRRKSCSCPDCGPIPPKEIRLKQQIMEVAMHKKIRLANYLIKNTDSKARKTAYIKQQFKIYAKNKTYKLHQPFNINSIDHDDDEQDISYTPFYTPKQNNKRFMPLTTNKANNQYLYFQNFKQSINRNNRTINQLVQSKKLQLSQHINTPKCDISYRIRTLNDFHQQSQIKSTNQQQRTSIITQVFKPSPSLSNIIRRRTNDYMIKQ